MAYQNSKAILSPGPLIGFPWYICWPASKSSYIKHMLKIYQTYDICSREMFDIWRICVLSIFSLFCTWYTYFFTYVLSFKITYIFARYVISLHMYHHIFGQFNHLRIFWESKTHLLWHMYAYVFRHLVHVSHHKRIYVKFVTEHMHVYVRFMWTFMLGYMFICVNLCNKILFHVIRSYFYVIRP